MDEPKVDTFFATALKTEVGKQRSSIQLELEGYGIERLLRFSRGEGGDSLGKLHRSVTPDGTATLTHDSGVTLTVLPPVADGEDFPLVPRDQQLFALLAPTPPTAEEKAAREAARVAYEKEAAERAAWAAAHPYVPPKPVPFDFAGTREILHRYPIETLLDFAKGKLGDKFDDIKRIEDEEWDYFLKLPNGAYVYPYLDNYEAYDLTDPRAIDWLMQPAGPSKDYDGEDVIAPYDIEELLAYHRDDSKPLTNISLGGTTDFHDRFGHWPHFDTEDGMLPLTFTGEFIYQGKRHYLFYDVKDHEEEYEVSEYTDWVYANPFAVIDDDGRGAPAWVTMQPLSVPLENVLGDVERWVPQTDEMPQTPNWIQNVEVPPAPYNHFAVEITSEGEIVFGDAGDLYLFTDDKGGWRIVKQHG